MPQSEDAALAAANKLLGESVEAPEVEEPEASGEETVVEEPPQETEEEASFFSLSLDDDPLPEELAEELDTPDFAAEAREEIDQLELDDETDPELLVRLREAEKRADHLEKLRVQEALKNWKSEAAKFFPFSEPFLDTINATSRRGFLREARKINQTVKPVVEERVLKPAREALKAERDKMREEIKKELEAAWGKPTVDGGAVSTEAEEQYERVERKRGARDLHDTIRAMVFRDSE